MSRPSRLPGCPTPDKQRYTTQAQAERDLVQLSRKLGDQGTLHPYECECGRWHLGRSRSGWASWRRRTRWAGPSGQRPE